MQTSEPSFSEKSTASSVPACWPGDGVGERPAPQSSRGRNADRAHQAPGGVAHSDLEHVLEEVVLGALGVRRSGPDRPAAEREAAALGCAGERRARDRRTRLPEIDHEPLRSAQNEIGDVLEAVRRGLGDQDDPVRPLRNACRDAAGALRDDIREDSGPVDADTRAPVGEGTRVRCEDPVQAERAVLELDDHANERRMVPDADLRRRKGMRLPGRSQCGQRHEEGEGSFCHPTRKASCTRGRKRRLARPRVHLPAWIST